MYHLVSLFVALLVVLWCCCDPEIHDEMEPSSSTQQHNAAKRIEPQRFN